MKKLVLIAFFALVTTMNVSAQREWDNEISVSYGFGANTDIVSTFGTAVFHGKQSSYWGPIGLEYFRRVAPKLKVGGILTVAGCNWDNNNDYKSVYYTALVGAKYNWLLKNKLSMYSKAGIGLTICADSSDKLDESESHFNWQASLVGFEYGSAFRVFTELGFGEQGIFLVGARYGF